MKTILLDNKEDIEIFEKTLYNNNITFDVDGYEFSFYNNEEYNEAINIVNEKGLEYNCNYNALKDVGAGCEIK